MDGVMLTNSIRRELTTYTSDLSSLFSDSRRRQFIGDMLTGLISGGHVHLTAIARGISGLHPQDHHVHAVEKRLSRHLGSTHWDMSPLRHASGEVATLPADARTAQDVWRSLPKRNIEFLQHMLAAHQAMGGQGTWLLDRGFDRCKLYEPLVKQKVAFVVRQRGDRTVQTKDGRCLL